MRLAERVGKGVLVGLREWVVESEDIPGLDMESGVEKRSGKLRCSRKRIITTGSCNGTIAAPGQENYR